MKKTDRIIQTLRMRKAAAYIPRSGRLLDIGCGDGALFRYVADRFNEGIGIDPTLARSIDYGTYRLIKGWFPQDLPSSEPFDTITMLATLEHIPPDIQTEMARACAELLNPSGRLIVTVPSKRVDPLLGVLQRMRLIDGMALEQHYGFDPRQTPAIFTTDGLAPVKSESFEFGLNHLFVFEQQGKPQPVLAAPEPVGIEA